MLKWFKKTFMKECFICRANTFKTHGVIRYQSAEIKDTGKYHEVPLCKDCTKVMEVGNFERA